jgi:signal transduction histidine kinase
MTPGTAQPRWFLAQRLAWRLAAVMLVSVLLAAAAVAWRTVATIRSLDDAALQSQARLVASQLSAGTDGRPVLKLPGHLAAAFSASDGQNLFVVYDRQDVATASSDPGAADNLQPYVPPRPREGLFRVPPSEAFPDGLIAVVQAAGPWRVVVAQAREQNEALVESLLREFLFSALWLLLPIGAATVLIGVLTIRHGLRPLRDASDAAARVGADRPGVRLPSVGLPGELFALVRAMNEALARLEQGLDAQRRFVATAAHALRTPLAVLTARLDALPDSAETAALQEDTNRMARLVGQLLTVARLEELPLDLSATVDLHSVAVEAISDLAPLAIQRRVELMLTEPEPPPRVKGNHAAIVLALSNLLDNALGHAPAGSIVEVELVPPATIRVLDHGPGVPEAERTAIFGRFHRGPGAHPGGSGLGLTIVSEIAVAHGGTVTVGPRSTAGGAAFALQLGPTGQPIEAVHGNRHPQRTPANS